MNPNKILHFYAVNPNKILHFYAVNPNQILDLYAVSPIRIIYLYRGKPLFAHFSYRRSMLTKLPSALSSRLTAYKIYPWSWADDEREHNKKSVTRKDICINIWLARVKVYLVYCIFQFNPWRIYHTKLFPRFSPGPVKQVYKYPSSQKITMKTSSRIINEISKDIQCRWPCFLMTLSL